MPKKTDEFKAGAVRLVNDHVAEHASVTSPSAAVARLGFVCGTSTGVSRTPPGVGCFGGS